MTLADPQMPVARKGPWLPRLIASRRFQSWAARFPLTRRIARKDGEKLFDLVSGFVYSQVLLAVVELRLLPTLMAGPMSATDLAKGTDLTADRMEILCDAAVALGLLTKRRALYRPGRLGAAMQGVPGLEAMIRHHGAFYRDLEDPVALIAQQKDTELAQFWPYVFGAAQAEDPDTARTYSDLMAQSQVLVAEDTLARVDLRDAKTVLDIGGGTGAFLRAVGARHKKPALHLFDLAAVVPDATAQFAQAGLSERVTITPGSFRDNPLPQGADVISLVRVLYDHADETVAALLSKIYDTLPKEGRLIVSEPMAGGDIPTRSGDGYFAFYTLAMQTGRARSPHKIKQMLSDAGFKTITDQGSSRAFVTHVIEARKHTSS